MLKVVNLTKSYPTPKGRHYVFRDLNFTFPEGKSIGLMGRNGAGKSTLMQILGGIDAPDQGQVVTDKTISWPVGLASGFQGSLTARDNIRFICRVYGCDPEVTRQKVQFVQDFAEIGKFFDMPMKTYSSGMRGRVGFGMSMAFDFDYYLIDEAMATGDPIFRKKAAAVFSDTVRKANVILVSHNTKDIEMLCHMAVVLDGGQATLYENVKEGVAVYDAMKQNMQRAV